MKFFNKYLHITISLILLACTYKIKTNIDQYYCTAADSKYFDHLLNTIGSIHKTNFENLQEIAVFDIGLTQTQLTELRKIKKIKIYNPELTNPDMLKPVKVNNEGKMVPGWYSWKPVVLKQSLEMFPYVLWFDAGLTVTNKLDNLFEYIKQEGYFLCTLGTYGIGHQTTKHLIDKFNLNSQDKKWILSQEQIISGIIGASKAVYHTLALPLYELTKDIKNFADDGTSSGGFGSGRHDQAVLGAFAYSNGFKAFRGHLFDNKPDELIINNNKSNLYITWQERFISDKTQIYGLAKVDHKNYSFKKFVKYIPKKLCLTNPKSGDWSLDQNFLALIKDVFGSEVFVETGTFYGTTTRKAAQVFDEVHTIELDKGLYNEALNNFINNPKIHVYQGDSKTVLKNILPDIKNKIVFFLDAHWSGPWGAKGEENTPLLSELKVIQDCNITPVIIVDDIRFCQTKDVVEKYLQTPNPDLPATGYPDLHELKKAILDINKNYNFIIYGDMAIAYIEDKNIEISNLIKALTVSRMAKVDSNDLEITEASKIISMAQGAERDGINALMSFVNPDLFSMHYRYWHTLTLINANKTNEAKEHINKLISLGFNNLKIRRYLSE